MTNTILYLIAAGVALLLNHFFGVGINYDLNPDGTFNARTSGYTTSLSICGVLFIAFLVNFSDKHVKTANDIYAPLSGIVGFYCGIAAISYTTNPNIPVSYVLSEALVLLGFVMSMVYAAYHTRMYGVFARRFFTNKEKYPATSIDFDHQKHWAINLQAIVVSIAGSVLSLAYMELYKIDGVAGGAFYARLITWVVSSFFLTGLLLYSLVRTHNVQMYMGMSPVNEAKWSERTREVMRIVVLAYCIMATYAVISHAQTLQISPCVPNESCLPPSMSTPLVLTSVGIALAMLILTRILSMIMDDNERVAAKETNRNNITRFW